MANDQSFLSNEYHLKTVPVTQFPEFINNRVVTTVETETPPTWAKAVVISADAAIWVNTGAVEAAAIPVGDVADGSGSLPLGAFQAECFDIVPGRLISVVSASGTARVAFRYYA